MWTKAGSRKGGLKGGRRVYELHPNQGKRNGRRCHELHPGLAHSNGVKMNHVRWHLRRGLTSPRCSECRRKGRNDGRRG
jgi:hypothetical protein